MARDYGPSAHDVKLTLCATLSGCFRRPAAVIRDETGQYQTHRPYNEADLSSAANFFRRASSALDGLSG